VKAQVLAVQRCGEPHWKLAEV